MSSRSRPLRSPAGCRTLDSKAPGFANDRGTPIADIVYGGFDRDVMQADSLGDRLVDSYGSYNLFYVCPAAYGGAGITRAISPGIQAFFQKLAQADGALGAATSGTSGYAELSFVYPGTATPTTPAPHTRPRRPLHLLSRRRRVRRLRRSAVASTVQLFSSTQATIRRRPSGRDHPAAGWPCPEVTSALALLAKENVAARRTSHSQNRPTATAAISIQPRV